MPAVKYEGKIPFGRLLRLFIWLFYDTLLTADVIKQGLGTVIKLWTMNRKVFEIKRFWLTYFAPALSCKDKSDICTRFINSLLNK